MLRLFSVDRLGIKCSSCLACLGGVERVMSRNAWCVGYYCYPPGPGILRCHVSQVRNTSIGALKNPEHSTNSYWLSQARNRKTWTQNPTPQPG